MEHAVSLGTKPTKFSSANLWIEVARSFFTKAFKKLTCQVVNEVYKMCFFLGLRTSNLSRAE